MGHFYDADDDFRYRFLFAVMISAACCQVMLPRAAIYFIRLMLEGPRRASDNVADHRPPRLFGYIARRSCDVDEGDYALVSRPYQAAAGNFAIDASAAIYARAFL